MVYPFKANKQLSIGGLHCWSPVLGTMPSAALHLVAAPCWEVGSGDPGYTALHKTPNPEAAPQNFLPWSLMISPWQESRNKQGIMLEIWSKSERVKLVSPGWKPREVLAARGKKGADVPKEKPRGEGGWGRAKMSASSSWPPTAFLILDSMRYHQELIKKSPLGLS